MANKLILSSALVLAACLAGNAQTVTVQFAGEVTSVANRAGILNAPVTGYFSYDPRLGFSQASSHPIFVIEVQGHDLLQMNSYSIGVWDNRVTEDGSPQVDGLVLNFSHPALDSGAGMLRLLSLDLNLFNNTSLPTELPSLDKFDSAHDLTFHRDFGNIGEPGNYWAVGIQLKEITVVPEPGVLALLAGAFAALHCFRRNLKCCNRSTRLTTHE